MTFKFIDSAKKEFPVNRLCKMMSVSSSGYFAHKKRPISAYQRKNNALLAHIRTIFSQSYQSYGSPRMTKELQAKGFAVGRRRIARLMRDNDLSALLKRRFKRTTDSRHNLPVASNVLKQNFTTTGPNQKWGTDITYIWTREGWLYLAVVIDFFSRRIIGFATSNSLHKELVIKALKLALVTRNPAQGLIHHSDRGKQYCSKDYQKLMEDHNITVSMSGKGNCYDNAMTESFFKTLKSDLVWRTTFYTRQQAQNSIALYINGFYNIKRRHSAINYNTPYHYVKITA